MPDEDLCSLKLKNFILSATRAPALEPAFALMHNSLSYLSFYFHVQTVHSVLQSVCDLTGLLK